MSPPASPPPVHHRHFPGLRALRTIAALLVAFGLGASLVHVTEGRHRVAMVALAPAPIADVKDGDVVAVKGQVGDIFGNRFVIADGSGKALVDTGPAGNGQRLVEPGETVTVEGRFERGSLHAATLSHADGRTDGLGPAFGPHPGPRWLRAIF